MSPDVTAQIVAKAWSDKTLPRRLGATAGDPRRSWGVVAGESQLPEIPEAPEGPIGSGSGRALRVGKYSNCTLANAWPQISIRSRAVGRCWYRDFCR